MPGTRLPPHGGRPGTTGHLSALQTVCIQGEGKTYASRQDFSTRPFFQYVAGKKSRGTALSSLRRKVTGAAPPWRPGRGRPGPSSGATLVAGATNVAPLPPWRGGSGAVGPGRPRASPGDGARSGEGAGSAVLCRGAWHSCAPMPSSTTRLGPRRCARAVLVSGLGTDFTTGVGSALSDSSDRVEKGRGAVKLAPLRRRSRGERGAVKLAPLRRRSRGERGAVKLGALCPRSGRERQMPYITSIERMSLEQGRQEGR
jgi:hypothetical protein